MEHFFPLVCTEMWLSPFSHFVLIWQYSIGLGKELLLLLGAPPPPQKFGTDVSILLMESSLDPHILGQNGGHQINISQLNEQIESYSTFKIHLKICSHEDFSIHQRLQ